MDESRVSFVLIPVYNTQAISSLWGKCIKGVEAILEYSTDDTSMAKIFNELMSCQALLWVAYLEENVCGFIITKITDIPFGSKSLWITELYIKTGVPHETFFKGLEKIKEYAIKSGCKKMRFYTVRKKGFLHKLESLGWTEGYQEIIYDLGG